MESEDDSIINCPDDSPSSMSGQESSSKQTSSESGPNVNNGYEEEDADQELNPEQMAQNLEVEDKNWDNVEFASSLSSEEKNESADDMNSTRGYEQQQQIEAQAGPQINQQLNEEIRDNLSFDTVPSSLIQQNEIDGNVNSNQLMLMQSLNEQNNCLAAQVQNLKCHIMKDRNQYQTSYKALFDQTLRFKTQNARLEMEKTLIIKKNSANQTKILKLEKQVKDIQKSNELNDSKFTPLVRELERLQVEHSSKIALCEFQQNQIQELYKRIHQDQQLKENHPIQNIQNTQATTSQQQMYNENADQCALLSQVSNIFQEYNTNTSRLKALDYENLRLQQQNQEFVTKLSIMSKELECKEQIISRQVRINLDLNQLKIASQLSLQQNDIANLTYDLSKKKGEIRNINDILTHREELQDYLIDKASVMSEMYLICQYFESMADFLKRQQSLDNSFKQLSHLQKDMQLQAYIKYGEEFKQLVDRISQYQDAEYRLLPETIGAVKHQETQLGEDQMDKELPQSNYAINQLQTQQSLINGQNEYFQQQKLQLLNSFKQIISELFGVEMKIHEGSVDGSLIPVKISFCIQNRHIGSSSQIEIEQQYQNLEVTYIEQLQTQPNHFQIEMNEELVNEMQRNNAESVQDLVLKLILAKACDKTIVFQEEYIEDQIII